MSRERGFDHGSNTLKRRMRRYAGVQCLERTLFQFHTFSLLSRTNLPREY